MSGKKEEPEYECEYMRLRAERIRKNEEYLASLGLGAAKQKMIDSTKVTKRNQARARRRAQQRVAPGEERRSGRISKKPKSLVMLSYDDDNDQNFVEVDKSKRKKRRKTENKDSLAQLTTNTTINKTVESRHQITSDSEESEWELSDGEREILTAGSVDEKFLHKFKEFLVFHNKISEQNVRNVMKQIGKLARGEGIHYDSPRYGWPKGCYFMKGRKVTPMMDIIQLMEEAQECEDMWGRDHGNGWLLSHPLKKLLLFQQFALNNPDFLTARCKLSDYYELDNDADLDMTPADEVTSGDISVDEVTSDGATLLTKAADTPDVPDTPEPVSSSSEIPVPITPTSSVSSLEKATSAGSAYEGKRVAKYFDGVLFSGTVQFREGNINDEKSELYHILYDDGDEEDLDFEELQQGMALCYEQENKNKRKRGERTRKASVTP